jgi:hypothetical protein
VRKEGERAAASQPDLDESSLSASDIIDFASADAAGPPADEFSPGPCAMADLPIDETDETNPTAVAEPPAPTFHETDKTNPTAGEAPRSKPVFEAGPGRSKETATQRTPSQPFPVALLQFLRGMECPQTMADRLLSSFGADAAPGSQPQEPSLALPTIAITSETSREAPSGLHSLGNLA